MAQPFEVRDYVYTREWLTEARSESMVSKRVSDVNENDECRDDEEALWPGDDC